MLKLKLGNRIHLHRGSGVLNSKEESWALGSLHDNHGVSDRIWTIPEENNPTSQLLLLLHLILRNGSEQSGLLADGNGPDSFFLCPVAGRRVGKAPNSLYYLLCDLAMPYLQLF